MATRKIRHEGQLGRIASDPVPDAPVSLSSEIVGPAGAPANYQLPEPISAKHGRSIGKDGIWVEEIPSLLHNYTISYVRYNGAHFGSMCVSEEQLRQIVMQASKLLGDIAVHLTDYDDYIEGDEDDE